MDDAIRVRQVIENRTAVTTALPDDSVATAALRMTEQRIGSLLIADADGKLVGIVSERDLMTKVVARKRNPETTLIKDVMSPDIISCGRNTTLSEAQHIMARPEIRHLPIIQYGESLGMISSRDILRHQLHSVQEIAMAQVRMLEKLERLFPGITTESGSA